MFRVCGPLRRRQPWHLACTHRNVQEDPPDKGTPVVRRGRKATGQRSAPAPDSRATERGRIVPPGFSWSSHSRRTRMKSAMILCVALVVAAFGVVPAFAQSSGSFNFNADTTACTDIGGLLGGGTSVTSLKTTMKVSSGNGVALVIRPSAVTGLLTNVSLSGEFGGGASTSSAQSAVTFSVAVTPLSG